jgi:predicted kinase
VLVWINGPFGVGKTTAAQRVHERDSRWRIFDPEWVGYMLRAHLAGVSFDDFQDLPAWRTLVPVVAHEVMKHTGDDLIAVQTVLEEQCWRELRVGLASHEIAVTHVVLDADGDALRDRIAADHNDTTAAAWRLDHIGAYDAARSWMLADADLVIDAATAPPKAIAEAILAAVR